MANHLGDRKIYGTTSIGTKGQVVIPADARKAVNLQKGQKLLVFGMGHDMIALAKLSDMEQFVSHLSGQLKTIDKIIKKNRRK